MARAHEFGIIMPPARTGRPQGLPCNGKDIVRGRPLCLPRRRDGAPCTQLYRGAVATRRRLACRCHGVKKLGGYAKCDCKNATAKKCDCKNDGPGLFARDLRQSTSFPWSEVEIQTNPSDVLSQAVAVNNGGKWKYRRIATRAREALRAKVHVEILGLEAPLRHEEPFNPAARGPPRDGSADRRRIRCARGSEGDRVGERWVRKRRAARCKEQPLAVGDAGAAAYRRQPVAGERLGKRIGEASCDFRTRPGAAQPGVFYVALDADDQKGVELIIA